MLKNRQLTIKDFADSVGILFVRRFDTIEKIKTDSKRALKAIQKEY